MTSKQFTSRRRKMWDTQAQAAEALGVTQGCVGHWETGRSPVPLMIQKLLDCLESKNHPTA